MSRIGAVLLAAGLSQRFGSGSKLLADLGGEPLIRHAARVVCASGLADVVVVTGREAEACREALKEFPVRFIHNAQWEDGMGASIASGVAALAADLDGAFIVPGDMPFLTHELFHALIRAFEESGAQLAVFPVLADGIQRAPVLWPRQLLPRLCTLSGASGGKQLLHDMARGTHAVSIADALLLTDIDTAEELTAARAHLARLQGAC